MDQTNNTDKNLDHDWDETKQDIKQQSQSKQVEQSTLNPIDNSDGQIKRKDAELVNDELRLNLIQDIPVNLSMELGSTEITIRELLQLNPGSVVELEKLAGDPLDVLVNGTLVARGEVVIVNEKFGIRLTDVISAKERIESLR